MAHRKLPSPKTLLGRHRLLSPTASVYVSPLCLGAMSLGTNWGGMMGEVSKEGAFELLNAFYDLGGNFIDTANMYQGGQSEEWIGEWMKSTGRRDEIVLSTKYSLSPAPNRTGIQSNVGGAGTKAMYQNINDSLKRLQTDYVDLFFVHSWDYATNIPELMQSLNNLVTAGKVHYLGVSNAPAWLIVKANCYAREHGLRQFSVFQGRYSAMVRDIERDVIPMCIDEGMAIHPYGVIGSGSFRAPEAGPKEGGRNTPFMDTGREAQVSKTLDGVAKRLNVPIQSVAIAYVMHKAPYVFPLIGGSKVSYLKSNAEALGIRLSPEDIAEIEGGYDFDAGYPHNLISRTKAAPRGPEDNSLLSSLGYFDFVQGKQPIKPHQGALDEPWQPSY